MTSGSGRGRFDTLSPPTGAPIRAAIRNVARIMDSQAREVAHALELDVYEIGICHACLSFVSFPLDAGDAREVRRALAFVAGDLWAEGLALPVQAALERARRAGVPHADAAIDNIAANGYRAVVVREIILRLAADLTRRTRDDLRRFGLAAPSEATVTPLRETDVT